MPHPSLQDGPLARVNAYDLTTPAGLALLRRFDAQFHRLPQAAREAALADLQLVLPLADRAEGLLVLPGGALAWRDGETILLPDPGSATGITQAAQLRQATLAAGALMVCHEAAGLRIAGGASGMPQSATLLPRASVLAPLLPALAEWRGPAVIHWHGEGAVVWEMVPAPPPLALAVSLVGEPLPPDATLPRFLWAMAGADESYQLLSSGLSAHLDEMLASEISDALRFALVAQWTDGGDSLASRLADGLALLPSAFAAEAAQPAGLAALAEWPRMRARLEPAQALIGIAAAEAGGHWNLMLRQAFLAALRETLPAGTCLLAEAARTEPAPLDDLAADRLVRGAAPAFAALAPLAAQEKPPALLRQVGGLALRLGVPVLLAVPDWGLCHLLDPAGTSGCGNGMGYGLGAALELFEDE
ncbi:hypothetical protein EBE87_16625 [Pseudoroseomonas wenyumeiae]|uniref:Uncharacterized protein n=1 Tax=Teichococcus wenyumeiae TaxID=2478470 RepID=A0A3A9JEK4_9PROT|nr:hypothetical protein [Pseudoroseomonas wenyumeiae]RKK03103.1 hypothetical protein D6Z83_16315 [Pseudoroseomonas wenyumeiae]RMI20109.1 hypothetical protein EBE87_16625 [Pseudoroseomonas wenyumeiae]